MTAPDWRDAAACRNKNPRTWFPWPTGHDFGRYASEAKATAKPAIEVCNGCPVRVACLEFAITNGEKDGVWGGMIPTDRRKLAKQRNKASA